MSWKRFTILCTSEDEIGSRWEPNGSNSRTVTLEDSRLVIPFMSAIEAESSDEVGQVVFGPSMSLDAFLRFLARLSPGFRGDVLVLREDGGAYLSAAAAGDGRILYDLAEADVDLYVHAHFDRGDRHPVRREERDGSRCTQ